MNAKTEFAEYYFQTLPASDYSTNMMTIEDIPMQMNFQPDKTILPAPNTQCYITIPVDIKPKFGWETAQFQYTKTTLWVRDPQDLFKKSYLRNIVTTTIVNPTVLITKKPSPMSIICKPFMFRFDSPPSISGFPARIMGLKIRP